MSLQSKADVQKQAFALIRTTPNFRHFATTRIMMARPRDMTPYGQTLVAPVESDRMTLYAFESEAARDKFIEDHGAEALILK